jgi:hypothetical protein
LSHDQFLPTRPGRPQCLQCCVQGFGGRIHGQTTIRLPVTTAMPSVLRRNLQCQLVRECPPERNVIGHTHSRASSEHAWDPWHPQVWISVGKSAPCLPDPVRVSPFCLVRRVACQQRSTRRKEDAYALAVWMDPTQLGDL